MINKFQQGGILAQIQQLPKEQLQLIMLAFAQWAQLKGVDLNLLQQDPNALEQALGQFMLEMQSTRAARHGAKLNYIKSLKHQCGEDEELFYFKRGGSVGCGCKKKMEEGGKTPKEKIASSVERFKKKKEEEKRQKELANTTEDPITGKRRKMTPAELAKTEKNKRDAYRGEGEGTPQRKKGGEIEKDCGGVKLKKGNKVCPKCGKVHSAGIGCAIAKFRMRGGIL